MSTRSLFCLFSVLASVAAHAETATTPTWLDRVTFRKTSDTKMVPEPASLVATFPEGESSIFDINAYLRVDVAPAFVSDKAEAGPFIEYHRLSLPADKEQNVLKAGLKADWTVGDLTKVMWTPLVAGSANYVRDWQSSTSGLQVAATMTPLFRLRAMQPEYFYLPNAYSDLFIAKFAYSPLAALEYQGNYDGPDDALLGSVLRLRAQVQINAYPAGRWLDDALELTATYAFRWGFLGIEENGGRTHHYLTTAANLYFLKDDKKERLAGVGLEFVSGEDPDKSFKKQKLWRVALKAQF